MNYKSFLFFIIVAVVSISVASYRRPGRKAAQKGWAPPVGNIDAIKIACIPAHLLTTKKASDSNFLKNGAIAKFSTIMNKQSYVCYVKLYEDKTKETHAGKYQCGIPRGVSLQNYATFAKKTYQLQWNPSITQKPCGFIFTQTQQGTQLRNKMSNLKQKEEKYFNSAREAIDYLNQDPTVKQLPVYMGRAPGQ